MMQINSMSDEVYALYQEGYECFHRLFNISPTGVRMYMNRQEGDPDYDPEHGIACYKKAVELGSADVICRLVGENMGLSFLPDYLLNRTQPAL